MRQTLLLAGGGNRCTGLRLPFVPGCQSGFLGAAAFHLTGSLAPPHPCDAQLSVTACLPVSPPSCQPSGPKPQNHLPSAWLPSSPARITGLLFHCRPQQSYRSPGALAHSGIVSAPRGIARWEARQLHTGSEGSDSSVVETRTTRGRTSRPLPSH
ncbi:unnamed protein product [Pleuronectes platessa]|uniref:Uncharacterized protein n=1 Tax=Pleuronectes platessa TaxID=8262 RepID=A0A9N7VHE4_PLEPL|nr:unnamed protein product [Pleuronectes platessa]